MFSSSRTALKIGVDLSGSVVTRCVRAALLYVSLLNSHAAMADHIPASQRHMQIDCSGRGTPTVVFDSGLGGSSLEWIFVKERLAPLTTVCSFDRAGYGGSDMGPLPRTSSRIANELYLLLNDRGIKGPYIFAGHSFGGYNMQLFARRYAYLTAGLVLIDASHPDQVERFLEPPLGLLTAPSSRYGIVQFSDPPLPHQALPPDVRQRIMRNTGRWKTRRTLGNELLSFRDSARQVKQQPRLPDLPVLVISRGRSAHPEDEKHALMESRWLDMQIELANLSGRAAHVRAVEAGHHVHIEQPELVAAAIGALVDYVRAGNGEETSQYALALSARTDAEVQWLRDSINLSDRMTGQ